MRPNYEEQSSGAEVRGRAALEAIRAIMAGASRKAAVPPDDGSLRPLAPHLFVLDMERGCPVYRLAGSAVRCGFGVNPHGRSYYENWSSDAHSALQSFFDAALEAGCAFHVFSDALYPWGIGARYETVLIPVTAAVHGFVGVSILLDGDIDSGRPAALQQLRRIAFLNDGGRAPRRVFPRPVLM